MIIASPFAKPNEPVKQQARMLKLFNPFYYILPVSKHTIIVMKQTWLSAAVVSKPTGTGRKIDFQLAKIWNFMVEIAFVIMKCIPCSIVLLLSQAL
jgi:hypothetical protein